MIRSLLQIPLVLVAMFGGLSALNAADPAATEKPIDLILAVDVSFSMTANSVIPREKATDPDGIRWDGLQFLIDTANEDDRIAIVLFRGDAILATAGIPGNSNGFLPMKTGRRALKDMIARLQKFEGELGSLKNQKSVASQIEESPVLKKAPEPENVEDFLPLPSADGDRWVWIGYGTSNLLTLQAIERWGLLRSEGADRRPRLVMLFTDGEDNCPIDIAKRRTPDRKAVNGQRFTQGAWDFSTKDEPRVVVWDGKQFDYMLANPELQDKIEKLADPKLDPQLRATLEKEKPELEKQKAAEVAKKTREKTQAVMRPYREAQVDVFTFGLGSSLDQDMLQQIVSEARPIGGRGFRGAYFFAPDNLALFRQLQEIAWGLRGRWKVQGIAVERTERETKFTTPALSLSRSLGGFVYSRTARGAEKPESVVVEAGQPAVTASVGESRSHLHLEFQVQPEADSRTVTVKHARDAEVVCEFGLRPISPQVEWLNPDPGLTYTLLDAVPIRVSLMDPKSPSLNAEMFKARATIFRAGDSTPAREFVISLTPSTQAGVTNRWDYTGSWDIAQAIRQAKGQAEAWSGEWSIDLELFTVCEADRFKDHPLGKASFRFLRRQFKVGGYPRLKFGPGRVKISNDGDTPGEGVLTFELDTKYAPSGDLLLLDGQSLEVQPEWQTADAKLPPLQPIKFVGKNGIATATLPLNFRSFDWSAISAAGRQLTLSARTNLPTNLKARPIETKIDLNKSQYRLNLSANTLVFDLSGEGRSSEGKDRVNAQLATQLNDRASLRLSSPSTELIEFQRVKLAGEEPGLPASIKLKCSLPAVVVLGSTGRLDSPMSPLELTLTEPQQKRLPPGRYEAKVSLVHAVESPAQIEPVPLTLRVLIDQMKVRFIGVRDDRLDAIALAGTTTVWPVELKMALDSQGAKITRVSAMLQDRPRGSHELDLLDATLTGANRLAALAATGGLLSATPNLAPETRFFLGLEVPPSTENTIYRLPIEFAVQATNFKGEAKSYLATSDVVVGVQRYGLTAKPILPEGAPPTEALVLATDPGIDTPAVGKILLTPTLRGMVRWTAELIPAPGTPPPPEGGKPWFDGLEILANDDPAQSILRSSLGVPAKPTKPLVDGQAQELTVKFNAAALQPGRYTCRIRFNPSVVPAPNAAPGEKGPVVVGTPALFELPLEVIVRGVIPSIAVDPSGKQLQVKLRCVKAEPGVWTITSEDHPGWESRLVWEKAPLDDVTVLHSAKIPALTTRGGPTRYQLTSSGGVGKPVAPVTVVVPAVLTLDSTLCAAGETNTVRVKLTTQAGAPPKLIVTRRGEAGAVLPPITLTDTGTNGDTKAGDGEYTGQFTFPPEETAKFGEYLVQPETTAPDSYPIIPASCVLGIAKSSTAKMASLEYSKGIFEVIYGPDQVSDSALVRVKVYGLTNPQYRVRVKYPLAGPDGAREQFLKDKPGASTEAFDPSIHLKADPLGPTGVNGSLTKESPHEFGLAVQLSDEAKAAIDAGNDHPTLNRRSGLILVVTISGTDSAGNPVTWEDEYPYVVSTKSFILRTGLIWLIVGVVSCPVGMLLFLRWKRRRNRKSLAATSSSEDQQDSVLESSPRKPRPETKPTDSPTPKPKPKPQRPQDDLF